MPVMRLLWRLARRRWVRRVLFWLVVRLVRLFGWRRTVKLLFRGRGRWRVVALGAWRVAVRLLHLVRPALLLLGWRRAHAPRALGHGAWDRSRSTASSKGWRRRIAHRRDDIRRSLLAAVGVDPAWRPGRKSGGGEAAAIGRRIRAEIGDRIPH